MTIPAFNAVPLTGDEKIVTGSSIGSSLLVRDFWSYCYSDLLWSTIRGDFAEFVVMRAVLPEIQRTTHYQIRKTGDVVDLWLSENQLIEIKSSSYLQSWQQKELSSPKFEIAKKEGWDSEKNQPIKEKQRWSHVYVFCLFAHTDKSTANPLDIHQWKFYAVETSVIDSMFGDQDAVSLSDLTEKLKLVPIPYSCLGKRVRCLGAQTSSYGNAC